MANTAVAGKTDTMGNPSMFGTCGKMDVSGKGSSSVGKGISKRGNLGKTGKSSTAIGKSKGMSRGANMGKKGY